MKYIVFCFLIFVVVVVYPYAIYRIVRSSPRGRALIERDKARINYFVNNRLRPAIPAHSYGRDVLMNGGDENTDHLIPVPSQPNYGLPRRRWLSRGNVRNKERIFPAAGR